MTKYEIMYIIRPTVEEAQRKTIIETLHNIFPAHASNVVKVKEWGTRELAYEIDHHTKGYYVVVDVEATEEARAEFDRVIRLNEDVIRYLIIKDVR